MKRISKADKNKLVKEILSAAGLTRDQAHYLIKTYIGLSFAEFCKEYKIQYHFLYDSLMSKRPFTLELQEQIKEAAFKKLKSKKQQSNLNN